jgi:hypothetical protein
VRIFNLTEAQHFFAGRRGFTAATSVRAYIAGLSKTPTAFEEASPEFPFLRSYFARDANRYLLLGASNLWRGADMLAVAAAPWAHVSMYYASFFFASATLLMLGAHTDGSSFVIDVAASAPKSQALEVHRRANKVQVVPGGGPHRAFWKLFYKATPSLHPLLTPALQAVLQPVSGDEEWMIARRNEINYEADKAFEVMQDFFASFQLKSFDPKNIKGSLTGPLATQFGLAVGMADLAFFVAKSVGLDSEGLQGLGKRSPTRKQLLNRFVVKVRPTRGSRYLPSGAVA